MAKRKPLDRRFTSHGDLLKAAEKDITRTFRDHLTPEAVVAIIALLQPADNYCDGTPTNERALNQVDWFRDTLLEMIGVDEFNQLINEVGL
jgi:hypothetical protein